MTKKLIDGTISAAEVNSKHGWSKPCTANRCANLPAIRIITWMGVMDFMSAAPHVPAHLVAARSVQMTHGRMVRLATIYACPTHRQEAERAAARAPSNVLVEINRGPTPDRFVSGRAGGSTV